MLKKGYGKIINVASMLSFFGGSGVVAYAASKGGVAQFSKDMSNELAGRGIRVNCIAPGGSDPNQGGLTTDPAKKAFVDTYIANTPLKRWANDDDIKGPVAFLASDAAAYITGATIVMDGGWTIW